MSSRERTVATALWLVLVLGAVPAAALAPTTPAGAAEVAAVEVAHSHPPVAHVCTGDAERSCTRPLPRPPGRTRSVHARGLPAPRAPDLS